MRVSKIENLQTAKKSRGWLRFWRNSDQKKSQQRKLFDEKFSNERNERKVPPKKSKNYRKKIRKILKIDIADIINYMQGSFE